MMNKSAVLVVMVLISMASLASARRREQEEEYDDEYYYDNEKDRDSGYSGGGGGGGGALGGINPLAALIAPLAALALLGAAAAVAINPILVQLAVVSGRKRRDLTGVEDHETLQQLEQLDLLENFLSRQPETAKVTAEQLLASYLDCSGLTNNQCLEYLACIYSDRDLDSDVQLAPEERNVISIILYNLMSNSKIPETTKERLRTSARTSRTIEGSCKRFECPLLAKM